MTTARQIVKRPRKRSQIPFQPKRDWVRRDESGHFRLKNETERGQTAQRKYTYRSWRSMMERCYTETNVSFRRYGGLGITVCDRWHSFDLFIEDLGHRPQGMTVDRLDNSKGYNPGNCRWATNAEQGQNRRTNHMVEIDGLRNSVSGWARARGLSPWAVLDRIKKGMDPITALSIPTIRGKHHVAKAVGSWRDGVQVPMDPVTRLEREREQSRQAQRRYKARRKTQGIS